MGSSIKILCKANLVFCSKLERLRKLNQNPTKLKEEKQ
jgi:hypothetical protein